MIVVYIFIGILIGAALAYMYMLSKTAALRKEIEMIMRQQADVAQLREKQFATQLDAAKEQMANMARQVMEQSARKLKEQNTENIGSITQPLKDAISDMRKAINENIKDSAQHSASFREQIRMMMESNRNIADKAEGLANVLRRDNKAAGNMGEIILGDLLASQGLTEGTHYEVQARLRDENGRAVRNDDTGREMQPDVILHYPQGQDAIIDSKVSLTAYQRYVNAETPEEKERSLQEHIKSVRAHVTELARKDYSKYVRSPREAVDFVIMFVPFESSLQLALANDPTLWRDAFERKVFITGEQNLLGILHMIHVAWVQNRQAENQEKVFGVAEQLLDRLGDFIRRYRELGDVLDKAKKAYDFADNKLIAGNQSVVKKGRELVDLGAKENANRKIPKPEDRFIG
ncbi:DNA recombination protein RmuC [Xylanibacter muris]|uniref:DNA recombination protein RmuC n=1 Tax=Xylanibacter muris TaxID=2736290 RepID=A0ABX2AK84_9BACT|nr:DNA recombination protein RmuC [Xylanibacter muris]NPD91609.1 DNA recombination protein RmuC [Xylanibacter muris]